MDSFNDPARLIDCLECDYQLGPEDDTCANGHKNISKEKEMIDRFDKHGALRGLEYKIEILQNESKALNVKATEAYKKRDLKTENKYQKQIDARQTLITNLKDKLVELKYENLDVEKEIKKKYKSHNWSSGERCNGCQMKEHTTFQWKKDGVRENWKDGSKGLAIEILEGMECEKKFG